MTALSLMRAAFAESEELLDAVIAAGASTAGAKGSGNANVSRWLSWLIGTRLLLIGDAVDVVHT